MREQVNAEEEVIRGPRSVSRDGTGEAVFQIPPEVAASSIEDVSGAIAECTPTAVGLDCRRFIPMVMYCVSQISSTPVKLEREQVPPRDLERLYSAIWHKLAIQLWIETAIPIHGQPKSG